MASQVRKNLENLTHSLYHHGLIKILILAELKKKDWVWEQFVYELSNSHLQSSLGNEPCEPCIPDLVDKASSVNISEHQISHTQEPTVKSCKKAGPSHTKKSPGSKGQCVNSQSGGNRVSLVMKICLLHQNDNLPVAWLFKRRRGHPKVRNLYMSSCPHPLLILPMISPIPMVPIIIPPYRALSMSLHFQHHFQTLV